MSDLAGALLDELLDKLAADPVRRDQLRELLAVHEEPAAPTPELMTLTQAGKVIGCSAKTVRRYIDAGMLRAVMVRGKPRVRADDLRAFVEGLDRPSDGPARRRRARSASGRFAYLRQ